MRISKPVIVWASSVHDTLWKCQANNPFLPAFWLLVMMFHHSTPHLKGDNIWKIRAGKLSRMLSWRRVNPLTWPQREGQTSHYVEMLTTNSHRLLCVCHGPTNRELVTVPWVSSVPAGHTRSVPVCVVYSSWPVLLPATPMVLHFSLQSSITLSLAKPC